MPVPVGVSAEMSIGEDGNISGGSLGIGVGAGLTATVTETRTLSLTEIGSFFKKAGESISDAFKQIKDFTQEKFGQALTVIDNP